MTAASPVNTVPGRYGSMNYWQERFQGPQDLEPSFDWYQRYGNIKSLVRKYVDRNSKVLVLGCGNSNLSADMVKDGYAMVESIDLNPVVIDYHQRQNAAVEALKWKVMDACNLKFDDYSFDAVIDKACLDMVLCGAKSSIRSKDLLYHAYRVLKNGGVYICVTVGNPAKRQDLFKKFPWRVEMVTVKKPKLSSNLKPPEEETHFIYICTRTRPDKYLYPYASATYTTTLDMEARLPPDQGNGNLPPGFRTDRFDSDASRPDSHASFGSVPLFPPPR